jgi:PAS domain S-box-containing protein
MSWFTNLPVQRKLGYAMLFTTMGALVLACALFLVVEYRNYRSDIFHTVDTLARLTAENSTAAIAFNDHPAARQILSSLQAEPQIVAAALYDDQGRLIASFRTSPDEVLPADQPHNVARTGFAEAGRIMAVQPVTEDTRRLGTLYVRASMDQIVARMRAYALVAFGVLVAAFGLAGLIAAWLRRTLARPILELARTAEAVSAAQDYSLRARQYGTDELGKLTLAFNAMLAATQQAVSSLRESEWHYRELVRALPTATYMCDADGYITICNAAAIDLWGREPAPGRERWCGSHRLHRPDGTPLPVAESPMAVALKTGKAVRGQEIIVERPDGSRRNVLPYPEPLRAVDGTVLGVVTMQLDITEQKRSSLTMRRLASMVESSDDAIIGKDLEGIVTFWNRAAERLYGYTAAEIIGQPVTLLMPPDRQDEEPSILERIRRDEPVEHYETVRQRRDGSLVDVSLSVSPIKNSEGRIIGASKIVRDITAAKQAEAALRASEEQLRLVTDNAPVFLLRVDHRHRYTFVNRAYAHRSGRTPAEMIGVAMTEETGAPAYAAFRPYLEAAFTGQRVEFEVLVPYERLGPRWVHVIYVPERDAHWRVTGVLGVLTDTGARKEAEMELKRARDEALAASRAKDNFLAALSHELRTPLNPVLLLASDAAADPGLAPEVRRTFDLIRKNVHLEARLIDDLLDLTSISRGKLHLEQAHCDPHAILRDAVANVTSELQEKQQVLNLELAQERVGVRGDSVRLQQVFWNILKNAVKFTPERGRLTLRSRVRAGGSSIVIEIADSGIGMSPQEIGRVFDAFAQGDHALNGAGSHRFGGLGLGLAISKMLVELHGGRIEARSDGDGHGSTFGVTLPCAPAELAPPPVAGTPPPFGSASGLVRAANRPSRWRILLVEDHAITRQTLQTLLGNRGYRVAAAASAAEALAQAQAEKFDLVISDVGLPDCTGYELMAGLLKIQPGLPGIALSGYGMEDDLAQSHHAGFAVHLVKPVTIGMLEDAIARLPAA